MSHLLKNLLIALAVVIGLVILYNFIPGQDEGADTTLIDSGAANQIETILANTQKLDTYDLDVSIFDNSKFTSLIDFSVALVDVGTGRSNPFAPVR